MTNLDSFQKVVLYIIQHTPGLGAIQLNKALFYVDVLYYLYYGKSYTGCEYVKEKKGPVPNTVCFNKIKKLISESIIVQQHEDVPNTDYTKKAYYINEKHSDEINNYFDNIDLLNILKVTVNFVSNKTAKQLSDFTHNNIYDSLAMREIIPLNKAVEFVIDDNIKEPENIEKILEEYNAN